MSSFSLQLWNASTTGNVIIVKSCLLSGVHQDFGERLEDDRRAAQYQEYGRQDCSHGGCIDFQVACDMEMDSLNGVDWDTENADLESLEEVARKKNHWEILDYLQLRKK
jgi:hypothetical protein